MSFEIEDRGNGTKWITVDQGMYQIAKWCRETGCGKQVNFRQISFNDDKEITMFLMRWQGEKN